MTFLSVLLALVAACSNAASNVIQRVANRDESDVQTLSLRLVVDLLHRPLWFAGLGFVILSFVLQAAALHFGPLSRVEPLLVFELPLTFLGAALFLGAKLGKQEWGASVTMTVGLAALVYFLHTSQQTVHVSWEVWGAGLAICEGPVAGLVVAGRRVVGDARAALYGAATGIQFGVTAALMNGAVQELPRGAGALFGAWQTYAMAASGIFAMFLLQNALQSGKLVAAQPGITLLDPFVAIVWGVFAFREQTAHSIVYLVLAAIGGLAMVVGAFWLSRSPVLQHGATPSPSGDDAPAGNGPPTGNGPPAGNGPPTPKNALSR